jgi:hypothetical protein
LPDGLDDEDTNKNQNQNQNKNNPFYCRENIMWTGHVLHVACLYERLTGDSCFREPGGIKIQDDGKVGVDDHFGFLTWSW